MKASDKFVSFVSLRPIAEAAAPVTTPFHFIEANKAHCSTKRPTMPSQVGNEERWRTQAQSGRASIRQTGVVVGTILVTQNLAASRIEVNSAAVRSRPPGVFTSISRSRR